MEAILTSIFDAIGIKNVVAMLAFSMCAGLGAFIDSEAKPEFKANVRASLQSGAWFSLFRNAYEHIGSVLDALFGKKLFSWRMMRWTLIITIGSSVISLVITLIIFPHISLVVKRDDVLTTAYVALCRIPSSFLIDYITLARVRAFCRRITHKAILPSLMISIVIDALTLILAILLNFASAFIGTSLVEGDWGTLGFIFYLYVVVYKYSGFLEMMLGFFNIKINFLLPLALASLLPAMIFYVYTLALIALKALMFVLRPIVGLSSHLVFKRPFLLIGNVAGAISALIIAGGEWVWEHVV